MSNITSQITTTAPDLTSFGAGGQMYMASMFTGFEIRRSRSINPLFSFTKNDLSQANAPILTNLDEARKIGSTMSFRAKRIGFRIVHLDTGSVNLGSVEAAKEIMSGAAVTLTLGSNETKVAEFSGLDLMQPVDMVGASTTDTAAVATGLGGGIGWIPLDIPIDIQANCNVGGTVKFNNTYAINALAPALDTDPAYYGFVVVLQGLKIVKS